MKIWISDLCGSISVTGFLGSWIFGAFGFHVAALVSLIVMIVFGVIAVSVELKEAVRTSRPKHTHRR